MRYIFTILLLISTAVLAEEYHGQKDRYNEALFKKDPEVLVSSPNKRNETSVYFYHKPEEVVKVENKQEEGIKVTTCVEYNGECKPSDMFQAEVVESKEE